MILRQFFSFLKKNAPDDDHHRDERGYHNCNSRGVHNSSLTVPISKYYLNPRFLSLGVNPQAKSFPRWIFLLSICSLSPCKWLAGTAG